MPQNLTAVIDLMMLSLRDARQGARRVIDFGIPYQAGVLGLALMAVLSTLLTQVGLYLTPDMVDPLMQLLIANPVRTAVLQGIILVASVVAIRMLGVAAGGRGSVPATITIVVWLQIIMLAVQIVQLAVMVVVPPLAAIIGIAGLVLFFWLLSHFVAELHGFSSVVRVFGAIVATILLISVAFALIMAIFIGPGAMPNV